MFNRIFTLSVRLTGFMSALMMTLGVTSLSSSPAEAALKKYSLNRSQLLHYLQTSPRAEYRSTTSAGVGLVSDDGNGSPVLKKFTIGAGTLAGLPGGSTTITPGLSGGFIYYKATQFEGPPPVTGSGAVDTSINWGNSASWSITGGIWCNSNPTYICDLAQVQLNATVPAELLSTDYDIGRWVFHGTGFTQPDETDGFIWRTGPTAPGNIRYWIRGEGDQDGTVPALPLLGLGTIGVSVIAMGVASIRRNRK
ncbi:hypothetical protein MK489_24475 [Myxococcota bacterium]|nr:hypothetical protein [Myxococcota bacterium]